MIQYKMYFEPNSLRKFLYSLMKTGMACEMQAFTEIPRAWSFEYRNVVIDALKTQKYAGGYAPYSEHYREWKYDIMRIGKGFWRLRDDLLRAIKIHQLGYMPLTQVGRSGAYLSGPKRKRYFVGISSEERADKKSWYGTPGDLWGPQKPIAMYAHVLEWGGNFRSRWGGIHPSRALFKPALQGFIRREARWTLVKHARAFVGINWR